jgi:integrase
LRHAREDEIIDSLLVFKPIHQSESLPKWIDRETQDKIIDLIEPWHSPIFLFMCCQWVRPSEARAIQVQDLDLEEGTVTIRRSFGTKGTDIVKEAKSKKERIIPIDDDVWEVMIELCKDRLPIAWVFTCQNRRQGKPYGTPHHYSHSGLQDIWKRVCRAVGICVNIYQETRHSVALQAINRGVSERLVWDFLGHSDSRVTRKYAHTGLAALRSVLGPKGKVIPLEDKKGEK